MAAKGEFALVGEKIQSALAKPGQPVKRGTMAHDHHLSMLLTESARHLHDLAATRRYAAQLEALAVRDGHRLYQAVAHRALGVAHGWAGEYAEAGARLNLAMELFRSLDTRWQIGCTLAALADLALTRGETAEKRRFCLEALQFFEAMGAAPDAARTRVALEAPGQT